VAFYPNDHQAKVLFCHLNPHTYQKEEVLHNIAKKQETFLTVMNKDFKETAKL